MIYPKGKPLSAEHRAKLAAANARLHPHEKRIQAFWSQVEKTASCWLWTGSVIPAGYGRFRLGGKTLMAHRVAFELMRGEIPQGLELDHLCRVPLCVNPAHLEAVPHRINLLRGETITGKNAQKTHCAAGHEFTVENTYLRRRGRGCRECRRLAD